MVVVVDSSIFVVVVVDGLLVLRTGLSCSWIGAEVVVVVYIVASAVAVVVVLKVVAAVVVVVVVVEIVVETGVVFEVITSLIGEQSVVWKNDINCLT